VDGYPRLQRFRSYSESFYMNGDKFTLYPQVRSKLCEIPSPSEAFVFIEEHEKSIGSGVFFLHYPGDAGQQEEAASNNAFGGAHWMQLPSDRHSQGCNISYGDGSVRRRRWLSPKHYDLDNPDVRTTLDFQDYRWLQRGVPQNLGSGR